MDGEVAGVGLVAETASAGNPGNALPNLYPNWNALQFRNARQCEADLAAGGWLSASA